MSNLCKCILKLLANLITTNVKICQSIFFVCVFEQGLGKRHVTFGFNYQL